jgi:DMSO reductase anchor subunit
VLPALVLAVVASPSLSIAVATVVAGTGLVAVVAGELIERSQFFRALASPRMPGDLA